jgi:hypothetical protein
MKTKVINGITYTHRTRAGQLARIICTDKVSTRYQVAALVFDGNAEFVKVYTRDLKYLADNPNEDSMDLLEGVEPEIDWSKVAIDTPVWCRLTGDWYKRHFAGVEKGTLKAWINGYTSHTITVADSWPEMRLTKPEGWYDYNHKV